MKLRVKIKIEKEVEVNVPIHSWEKASEEQRLEFALKQMKEEMYVSADHDEDLFLSYIPENKNFSAYKEYFSHSEHKKVGKHEKQK